MWFNKWAPIFSPVHCMWLLVSLCVCGTSNFVRFFFVGTIDLRYVLRYILRYILFISLVFSVRFMWDVYVKCGLDVCLTYEQVV